jgi:hypothetical protein
MPIVGAGVIGTVHGAHVAAAGHPVSVLRREPRTGDVAAGGMCARDVLDGERAVASGLVSIERMRVSDATGSFASRSASEARSCSAACPGGGPVVPGAEEDLGRGVEDARLGAATLLGARIGPGSGHCFILRPLTGDVLGSTLVK